jgi:hypothetical protein
LKNQSIKEEEIFEKEIFTIVEKQPSFPGGEPARMVYFAENLKVSCACP